LVIVTWLEEGVQIPLLNVHWNTYIPVVRPVTSELDALGLTMEGVFGPLIIVHVPVLLEGGTFPLRKKDKALQRL
jgi:hypothetical protein